MLMHIHFLGAQCVQTSMGPPQHTVSMHQQVAQQQGQQVLQTQQGGQQVLTTTQSGNTTITTMSPLQQSQGAHPQQISTDWSHGRAVSFFVKPFNTKNSRLSS